MFNNQAYFKQNFNFAKRYIAKYYDKPSENCLGRIHYENIVFNSENGIGNEIAHALKNVKHVLIHEYMYYTKKSILRDRTHLRLYCMLSFTFGTFTVSNAPADNFSRKATGSVDDP